MSALTQTERVLAFIAANPGCTVMDMARGLDPFVANPRARISDARAAGHNIECRRRDDGRNGFWIMPARIDPVQVAMFFAEAS